MTKTMKVFLALFAVSAVALVVTAILIHFPQAETAMFSIFSVSAFVSLVGFVVATVKKCNQANPNDQFCLCTTADKAMKVFGMIFLISVVAVAIAAVITQHPHGSTASYTIFSITGGLSFIAILIQGVKDHGKRRGSDPLSTGGGSRPTSTVPPSAPASLTGTGPEGQSQPIGGAYGSGPGVSLGSPQTTAYAQ